MFFIGPGKALQEIAAFMRQQRIQNQLTQADLSQRSGVPLATLRKFEQTGLISLESFLKLAAVFGLLGSIVKTVEPQNNYNSLDEIIKANREHIGHRVRRGKKYE